MCGWLVCVRRERASEELCFGRLTLAYRRFFVPCVSGCGGVAPKVHILRINYNSKNGLLPLTHQNYLIYNISVTSYEVSGTGRFFRRRDIRTAFVTSSIFLLASVRRDFSLVVYRSIVRRVRSGTAFVALLYSFLMRSNGVFVSFPTLRVPFNKRRRVYEDGFLDRTPFVRLLPGDLCTSLLEAFNRSRNLMTRLLRVGRAGYPLRLFRGVLEGGSHLRVRSEELCFVGPRCGAGFKLAPQQL